MVQLGIFVFGYTLRPRFSSLAPFTRPRFRVVYPAERSLMLWTIFIYYCVIAIVAVTGINLLGFFVNCGDEPALVDQMTVSQKFTALTLVLLVSVGFGPVLLPFMIFPMWTAWKEGSKESEYWIRIKEEHVRMSLDSMHEANVNPELAEHFETQSEAPLALGYQHLGDVWVKPQEPYQSKTRLLLHPDGIAFADVGRTIDLHYCQILSFLDDGTVLATVDVKAGPLFKKLSTPKHRYYIQCLPDMEIEELLAKHEQLLKQMSLEAGVGIRTITDTNWKALYHYHNDRYGQLNHELDGGDPVGYDVVFPAANDETMVANRQLNRSSNESLECVGSDNPRA